MATKTQSIKLTDAELKYQRRVKSVELAIKATVGKNAAMINTVMKAAEEIYQYISQ